MALDKDDVKKFFDSYEGNWAAAAEDLPLELLTAIPRKLCCYVGGYLKDALQTQINELYLENARLLREAVSSSNVSTTRPPILSASNNGASSFSSSSRAFSASKPADLPTGFFWFKADFTNEGIKANGTIAAVSQWVQHPETGEDFDDDELGDLQAAALGIAKRLGTALQKEGETLPLTYESIKNSDRVRKGRA